MKIIFWDVETKFLFKEVGGRYPEKLKVSLTGTLLDGRHLIFEEEQILELINELLKADLIVGYNIIEFDYQVLKAYISEDKINLLKEKTLDMFLEIRKFTKNCWPSLDDLAKRNVGMIKTHNSEDIPKMWRDGKKEEVKNYLINDLKMTEAIYNHGKNVGKFKYEHKEFGKSLGEREVAVKW